MWGHTGWTGARRWCDGKDRVPTKAHSSRLRLPTGSELIRLYASVDVFVLPSHGEGWGLPYMEVGRGGPCSAL